MVTFRDKIRIGIYLIVIIILLSWIVKIITDIRNEFRIKQDRVLTILENPYARPTKE